MPAFDEMHTYLVNLNVDKIALCNEGANSRADILLTKRKENNEMPKTFDEILLALNPDDANVIKSHITNVTKEKDDKIVELNDTIAKNKPQPAAQNDEDIFKNASPEMVAYVKSLKASVDTLVSEQAETLAKARFEKVKAIPVEEAELKDVLKTASPAVFSLLEKAAKAIEGAVLKTPTGEEGGSEDFKKSVDAAYDSLEKSAKEIMGVNKTLTFEQAFSEACTQHPDVYAKYVKGVK